ncbi:MAG: aspartate carbamoyltransferase regulatory subunit [Candidatus Nitrosocaldaceae archaeon]|nr:MAG: aspartate carbamoyltransferase regulatory subunit [Candidatus Nitrosocaldaceae archaeon]GIU72628.1 MAG: aspartate carbamoyltransferase regulatory subunit [Candidatus Nitrosocaldaceae archaeon]
MSEEQLLVRRIKDGTVIDHIDSGKALIVLKALNITGNEGNVITIAMNVPSDKLGKKDIIKVENRFLEPEETNKLALFAPHASINIISNYKVKEKRNVELPDKFIDIIKCVNPNCITNSGENISSVIEVIDKHERRLRCRYCRRLINVSELLYQI